MTCINFLDKLRIQIRPQNSKEASFLKEQYLCYLCDSGQDCSDMELSFNVVDNICIKNPVYIGKEAVFTDKEFFILDENKRKLLFDFGKSMTVERGFSLGILVALFRSWILVSLIEKKVIPVHGSGSSFRGKGTLFTGWGGTGKTKMILRQLDLGAAFVGDDWVLIMDNFMYPLKDKIELCDYDMKEYPHFVRLSFFDRIRRRLNCFSRVKYIGPFLIKIRLILSSKVFCVSDIIAKRVLKTALNKVYFMEKAEKDFSESSEMNADDVINKSCEVFLRENKKYFYYYGLFKYAFPYQRGCQEILIEEYKKGLKACLSSIESRPLMLSCNFNDVAGIRID